MSHKRRKRGQPQSHVLVFKANSEWELANRITQWMLKKNKASEVHYVKEEDGGDGLYRVAVDLLIKDYCQDVRYGAETIIDELLSDEAGEDWSDRIDEYVDGHHRVIYTAQAQATLLCSSNAEYGVTEGLVDRDQFKDGIPWSALAHWAFREDIRDRLSNLNVGRYDQNNETEDPLEPACEWEEVDEEREEDGETEQVTVHVCTFEFKGESYEGRGDDREKALANLRTDYAAKGEARRAARRALAESNKSRKATG